VTSLSLTLSSIRTSACAFLRALGDEALGISSLEGTQQRTLHCSYSERLIATENVIENYYSR
jgi:hypothetical protein